MVARRVHENSVATVISDRPPFQPHTFALLTLAAVCLWLSGCGRAAQLRAARTAYARGQLGEADAQLLAAMQSSAPNSAEFVAVAVQLGEVRVAEERYAEAKEFYMKALSAALERPGAGSGLNGPVDEHLSETLLQIGKLSFEIGDYGEAEGYYKRLEALPIVATHPNRELALCRLARIYSLQRKYADAESTLAKAHKLLGGAWAAGPAGLLNALILTERGYLAAQEGQYAAAEELYQKAMPLLDMFKSEGPAGTSFIRLEEAEALGGFGRVLTLDGKYAEADGYLTRSLALRLDVLGSHSAKFCPALVVARAIDDLASLRTVTGRHEEAAQLLRRAVAFRDKLGAENALAQDTRTRYAAALREAGASSKPLAIEEKTK